nr:unnamed protein product [Callosobruchus chinensis]
MACLIQYTPRRLT